MKKLNLLIGCIAAVFIVLLRWSCRIRWHQDPRPALREAGTPYAYAFLHCHQVAAVIGREPGTAAMVSRSVDGDLLVPSLRVSGVIPLRGSTRSKGRDKGGAAALERMVEHVRGGAPGYVAIDGPRGPRNHVQRGIAKLAIATGAAVLIAVPLSRRRWILQTTWDRFQIPKPFTRIDIHFGEPVRALEGEDVDALRDRIGEAITALEERLDPAEASLAKEAARAERRARAAASERATPAAPGAVGPGDS
jgi:lysophospholipid acyltransferase (LPLAT)-like uncharacterized protein